MSAHDICLKCFKTSWTQIKLDKICSVGWWRGEGIISLMTQFSCYIGIVCCSTKNNVKRIRHTPKIWNYSINTHWNNRNPSTVMLLVKLPLPGLILVQQRYVAIRKMRLLPTELPNRWQICYRAPHLWANIQGSGKTVLMPNLPHLKLHRIFSLIVLVLKTLQMLEIYTNIWNNQIV